MSLEPTTVAIVELAWARLLGLADDAFPNARRDGLERITRVDDDAKSVTFVKLFDVGVLVGPQWAVDAAVEVDDDSLALHSTMLDLTHDHDGHGLGAAALYYSDVLLEIDPSEVAAVSREPKHSAEVEGQCPPDDVNEVGLTGLDEQFALVTGDGLAIAGSGYNIWEGIIAHLGTLVTPELRQQGLATYVTAVAVEEAMASGLVPQWRARLDNDASRATAAKLGFDQAGTQTTVLLG
ncbi:GNAT family N-acetyltransferase [Arthrobacter monumenti]